MSKRIWIVGGALVVAAAVAYAAFRGKNNEAPKYRKERVDRGDVVSTVTATGTLSAVTTVKVGSQVSGIISRLSADFNSEVKKGQLLAELDPTPFQAAAEQKRADRDRARVELRNTELAYARSKNLLAQQLLSQSEFDIAQANRDSAAEAVKQAEAALRQTETNLTYTKISSPIDGVVVDRQIDVGQTVAASFQAPTLFTIAQDLTKMQVLTNLDEADIGRIRVGQEATFTVDAFPDRTFQGSVSQIRLSPQTVQNVVTYPVVLDVGNPEGNLKPGMTANVVIPVDRRKDVLKVPNAALRFKPAPDDVLGAGKEGEKKPQGETAEKSGAGRAGGERPASPAGGESRASGSGAEGRPRGEGRPHAGGNGGSAGGVPRGPSRSATVYLQPAEGQKLKPVKVKTSITDGTYTAVESDELKEGDPIVVGLATARVTDLGGGQRPGGGGGRGGPRF